MLLRRVNLDYLDRKLVPEDPQPRRLRVARARLGAGEAVERAVGEAGRRLLGLARRRVEPVGAALLLYPYWIYLVEFEVRALPLWRLSRHRAHLAVDGLNGHTTFADGVPEWEWQQPPAGLALRLFVDGRAAERLVDAELPRLAAVNLGGHVLRVRKAQRLLVYKPVWAVVLRSPDGRRAAVIVDAVTGGVGVVWYPRGRRLAPALERAEEAGLPADTGGG